MRTLIVAEKPSVARDIAKVLACRGSGDGFIQSDEYVVSWAVGHLVTLCEPEDYNEAFKKWSKATLPIMPAEMKLKPIAKTKKQLGILKKLMTDKEIGSIICATDSGREGELIFRYIYSITKCKKPFQRLWISSMTDEAIREGFKNLKDGAEYDALYASAKCRSEADWLVGINATRAYTVRYNALLSIGRVQTPTLAIIVERQKEINAFVPKPYWELKVLFEANNTEFSATWFEEQTNETKIFERERAEDILNFAKEKPGTIQSVEREEKKQPAPLLYDLTELQRDCNRRFGYSAQQTLSIAQDLYEKHKLITYPRTDSRYLSEDLVPKLKSTLSKLTPYAEFTERLLALPNLPVTKRIADNTKISDHHAIIPTGKTPNFQSLSEAEQRVFDLVARRLISVFYPNYITGITKIITTVADEQPPVASEARHELFLSKGTTVVQLGWMELYKNDKREKGEELLPDVEQGDEVKQNSIELLSKTTQPPKTYTEATLLSAMENAGRFIEDEELKERLKDSGLGTPATRAATIERLLAVGYIERQKKALVPTEKGMRLIEVVPKELKSPETTGKWERGLASIAKGKMDANKFMQSIGRYVRFLIADAEKATTSAVQFPQEDRGNKKHKSAPSFGICPKCGGRVLENTKSFYCDNWRNGCKFSLWKNSTQPYGVNLTPEIAKTLLKEQKVCGIALTLPQTQEKCTAELVLKPDNSGAVEFINLNRIAVQKEENENAH